MRDARCEVCGARAPRASPCGRKPKGLSPRHVSRGENGSKEVSAHGVAARVRARNLLRERMDTTEFLGSASARLRDQARAENLRAQRERARLHALIQIARTLLRQRAIITESRRLQALRDRAFPGHSRIPVTE